MSLDHSFTSTPVRHLPLQVFLLQEHARFVAAPGRLLQPLIDSLAALHQSGHAHKAVMPSCMLVLPSGEIDVEFFKTRKDSPDPVEAHTYYPEGHGDSLDACQRRDLQALGAVMHLIVAGQPPASPGRRVQRLAEQPAANEWPAAFIGLVDRLLDTGREAVLPTLPEISATLDPVVAPVVTAVAAVSETPEHPVAGPAGSATETVVTAAAGLPLDPAPPIPAARRLPAVRLPNAMVGRDYSVEIAAVLNRVSLSDHRIEPLSEIPSGLEIRAGSLEGTPKTAGEFEIHLRCDPAGEECVASLTINPDPQSLWKNNPSDRSGEFWKPDAAVGYLADGPLTVLGASLRGRSHAHVGSFRDDDMAMAWFPGSAWYSLTVADGAGSAKYSRQGSKIACDSMKAHFTEYFAAAENALSRLLSADVRTADAHTAIRGELYQQFGKAVIQARKAIEDQAAASQATSRDFHTTLITLLLHPLEDGSWFVATFSIGDGAAAIIGVPNGCPCLLSRPDGGDYAGQTMFLTMPETLATYETIMGRIQMAFIPDFEAVMLVTDGISDPRFHSETALADPRDWSALWHELNARISSAESLEAAASAILRWMEFHSPGHHDDRTLVLAKPSRVVIKP